MTSTTTPHGFQLLGPTSYEKYTRLYCRDEQGALEDIRQILSEGKTLKVVTQFETFYGVCWGDWLINGTKDIATAEVVETWDAWGECHPYPSEIVLTPIKK